MAVGNKVLNLLLYKNKNIFEKCLLYNLEQFYWRFIFMRRSMKHIAVETLLMHISFKYKTLDLSVFVRTIVFLDSWCGNLKIYKIKELCWSFTWILAKIDTCGTECLLYAWFFEGFMNFQEHREDVEDDLRP